MPVETGDDSIEQASSDAASGHGTAGVQELPSIVQHISTLPAAAKAYALGYFDCMSGSLGSDVHNDHTAQSDSNTCFLAIEQPVGLSTTSFLTQELQSAIKELIFSPYTPVGLGEQVRARERGWTSKADMQEAMSYGSRHYGLAIVMQNQTVARCLQVAERLVKIGARPVILSADEAKTVMQGYVPVSVAEVEASKDAASTPEPPD